MRCSQLMEVYISEQNEKGSWANFMFHFSSFRLKFLPCVYKVVYQLGYKYVDFFHFQYVAHLLEAQHLLLLEASSCPVDLGIQFEGPASFPVSGRDWSVGAASMTNTASSWQKKVLCRPVWPAPGPAGMISSLCRSGHTVPKVPAFLRYSHVFCCCFLSMSVLRQLSQVVGFSSPRHTREKWSQASCRKILN